MQTPDSQERAAAPAQVVITGASGLVGGFARVLLRGCEASRVVLLLLLELGVHLGADLVVGATDERARGVSLVRHGVLLWVLVLVALGAAAGVLVADGLDDADGAHHELLDEPGDVGPGGGPALVLGLALPGGGVLARLALPEGLGLPSDAVHRPFRLGQVAVRDGHLQLRTHRVRRQRIVLHIQLRQHLARPHPLPDLDLAANQLAADPEADTGLHTRAHIAGQRLLVLSSDKGYTHEDELYYLTGQAIQFHGSFSTMVNYHAMGQFIRGRGGVYIATSQRQLNLKTVALLLGGDADYFADTLLEFRERVDTFGPYDYYTLINHLRVAVQQNLSMDGCMELLRLSHFDPQIFLEFNRILLENAANLNDTARAEMQVALERIWDNFFPLGKDLPFEIARMYLAIRRPREALRYNEISLQMFGEHPVTYCNMGICHYHAEDYQEARRYFARSLALNPDYGLPKAWLARVNAEQERLTS